LLFIERRDYLSPAVSIASRDSSPSLRCRYKQSQRMNSTLYFAAAGLFIFIACLGAGRKVHRHLMRPKLFATLVAISLMTLLLIWLLLIALTRKEAEPPRQPADYSAPSGTG
jgi:hypothetical protein